MKGHPAGAWIRRFQKATADHWTSTHLAFYRSPSCRGFRHFMPWPAITSGPAEPPLILNACFSSASWIAPNAALKLLMIWNPCWSGPVLYMGLPGSTGLHLDWLRMGPLIHYMQEGVRSLVSWSVLYTRLPESRVSHLSWLRMGCHLLHTDVKSCWGDLDLCSWAMTFGLSHDLLGNSKVSKSTIQPWWPWPLTPELWLPAMT